VAPPASSSTGAAVRSVGGSMPPHAAFPLPTARPILPPVSSANIGLSAVNSSSITFASSVPPFNSASKPVVARLMAQQKVPGVLALSGMLLYITICKALLCYSLNTHTHNPFFALFIFCFSKWCLSAILDF